MDDAGATVRNAALVLVQRGVQAAGGLCFAALVPRLMGPEAYGRYALVVSVAFWFALVSGLGFVNATTLYIPRFLARRDMAGLHRFVGNLLTLRVASALAAAAAYSVLALAWWRELDAVVLILMSVAVFLQGVSGYLYSLFLGFNRAQRWAVGDTVRRWLLLALVIPGFQLGHLRGAAVAVVVTELVVLGLGIAWSELPRAGADLKPDAGFLSPYLRFGLAFLVIQLLYVALQGSGEILVRLVSGAYTDIGFFSLSHGLYLVGAALLPQIVLSFAPLLSRLRHEGQASQEIAWSTRLVRIFAAGGVVGVFGALFLAQPYVPLLVGHGFGPVATNLLPLSLAFLAHTLGSVMGLLALVHERSRAALVAAATRLAVFWTLGIPLTARWGSLGTCVGLLAAVGIHSVMLSWLIRDLSGPVVRAWALAVAPAALALPFLWLRTLLPRDIVLVGVLTLLYGSTLVLLRVVRPSDLAAVARLLRPRVPGTSEPTKPDA
ncbi:MAG TPA: lipopolysaccharide biosynthesis protein [Candidatus Bathyarchaeia archaeon]|nr:lipopolysaccharide biosynthesis protein [Candidatus Bathyarchaeia archaeon]